MRALSAGVPEAELLADYPDLELEDLRACYGYAAELVDRLLGSLPAEIPSALHPAWRNVVQRRSAELDSGTVTPVPWDEVRKSAWEVAGGSGFA